MTILSYAPAGYHGHLVHVEVDCRLGIPGMDIVGLAASEVREARDRARVAIRNSGFRFPDRRILVSLSPADVPKVGNGFDLAIAAAILLASEQLPALSSRVMMIGELHLDGRVGPVRGVLAAVAEGVEHGIEHFVVPPQNLDEVSAVAVRRVATAVTLAALPRALHDLANPSPRKPRNVAISSSVRPSNAAVPGVLSDYADLRGLADVKRALQIAAAGGHHALLAGPPGGGKSAAASLLPTILTPPSRNEAIEITRIHSLAHESTRWFGLASERPFRSPHHNTSTEGLLGGRMPQIPGEVALAHGGVLFLDEALEFRRPVLQALREPIEHRRIRVARARGNYWFPAAFQLVLATNLCPCGMLGRNDRPCLCSVAEVERYWRRLGGPLLDRIDLRVYVPPRPLGSLPPTDSSAELSAAVHNATRFREDVRNQRKANAELSVAEVYESCAMSEQVRELFVRATRRFSFSTRASLSVLRVARTVADLAQRAGVEESDVLEAISFRAYGEVKPLWEAAGGAAEVAGVGNLAL